MAKLIQVDLGGSKMLWVNPDAIESLQQTGDSVELRTVSGAPYKIRSSTVQQIASWLANPDRGHLIEIGKSV